MLATSTDKYAHLQNVPYVKGEGCHEEQHPAELAGPRNKEGVGLDADGHGEVDPPLPLLSHCEGARGQQYSAGLQNSEGVLYGDLPLFFGVAALEISIELLIITCTLK